MLKTAGIFGFVTAVEIEPNFVQQILELRCTRRDVVSVLAKILVTVLHGSCLHDGLQEEIHLTTLHTGMRFLATGLSRVVIQQGHKGLVGRTLQGFVSDAGEEGILGILTVIWFLAFLDVDGVIRVGSETVGIQFPQFLDSITEIDVQVKVLFQCVLFGPAQQRELEKRKTVRLRHEIFSGVSSSQTKCNTHWKTLVSKPCTTTLMERSRLTFDSLSSDNESLAVLKQAALMVTSESEGGILSRKKANNS